jgi:ATP-dependent DNA helicase RecQ
VVDECHCLWDWGLDFRPAFRFIPEILNLPTITRSLWLTATLPSFARKDLQVLLDPFVKVPVEWIGEFKFPSSVQLKVIQDSYPERMARIRAKKGKGLIFVPTRKMAEDLCVALGSGALYYHAGLWHEERQAIAQRFAQSANLQLVSTSAFGMGMHVPDIRHLTLWQPPSTLIQLAQWIGRCGRSGEKSEATLHWNRRDLLQIASHIHDRRSEWHDVLRFMLSEDKESALERYFRAG